MDRDPEDFCRVLSSFHNNSHRRSACCCRSGTVRCPTAQWCGCRARSDNPKRRDEPRWRQSSLMHLANCHRNPGQTQAKSVTWTEFIKPPMLAYLRNLLHVIPVRYTLDFMHISLEIASFFIRDSLTSTPHRITFKAHPESYLRFRNKLDVPHDVLITVGTNPHLLFLFGV